MTQQRFPIRIGPRSTLLLQVLFGVTPERAFVIVDDGLVTARFGRFEVRAAAYFPRSCQDLPSVTTDGA